MNKLIGAWLIWVIASFGLLGMAQLEPDAMPLFIGAIVALPVVLAALFMLLSLFSQPRQSSASSVRLVNQKALGADKRQPQRIDATVTARRIEVKR